MSELYKSDLRVLVGREHGQLGELKKSLGMKQATEVVEYAIRNLGTFAQKSAKEGGKDIFPQRPSVGWFHKYHSTALQMPQEELQLTAKRQEKAEVLDRLSSSLPSSSTFIKQFVSQWWNASERGDFR